MTNQKKQTSEASWILRPKLKATVETAPREGVVPHGLHERELVAGGTPEVAQSNSRDSKQGHPGECEVHRINGYVGHEERPEWQVGEEHKP